MKANLTINDDMVVGHVQSWLSNVVIGLGLCPFAKSDFDGGRIHYTVLRSEGFDSCVEAVMAECAALDKMAAWETSLLIFLDALADFYTYLDVIDRANSALKFAGYEGIYQLASFHPDYLFAEVSPQDASHYTNRSPYPIIHILRETSVEAAVKSYPNPKNIPSRNIQLTQKMGTSAMQSLLTACFK